MSLSPSVPDKVLGESLASLEWQCSLMQCRICHWDLSDRPQLANQHVQTKHTTLSTGSFTQQFRIISELSLITGSRWQILVIDKNVPANLWNTWALPSLHQWVEHFLYWWPIKCLQLKILKCAHICKPLNFQKMLSTTLSFVLRHALWQVKFSDTLLYFLYTTTFTEEKMWHDPMW